MGRPPETVDEKLARDRIVTFLSRIILILFFMSLPWLAVGVLAIIVAIVQALGPLVGTLTCVSLFIGGFLTWITFGSDY